MLLDRYNKKCAIVTSGGWARWFVQWSDPPTNTPVRPRGCQQRDIDSSLCQENHSGHSDNTPDTPTSIITSHSNNYNRTNKLSETNRTILTVKQKTEICSYFPTRQKMLQYETENVTERHMTTMWDCTPIYL